MGICERLPPPERKAELFDDFLAAFEFPDALQRFVEGVKPLRGERAHLALTQNSDLVLAHFATLPPRTQAMVRKWVAEMVIGMRKFVLLYPNGIRIQTVEEDFEHARSPRCEACPIADQCAWRLAGYPVADGPSAPKQKKYEGSDRQVRGIVLAELRASDIPVTRSELVWPDTEQLDRAIAGLILDGLIVDTGLGFELPS